MADKMMRIAGRDGGVARPVRADKFGSVSISMMSDKTTEFDFRGKVAGNVTPVPHEIKATTYAGLLSPRATKYAETSQDHYTRVGELNGTKASLNTGSLGLHINYVVNIDLYELTNSTTINELRNNFSELSFEIYAHGRGESGGLTEDGVVLSIFNYTASVFETITEFDGWDNYMSNPLVGKITNIDNYVENGVLSLNLMSKYPAGANSNSYVYIDYLSFEVSRMVDAPASVAIKKALEDNDAKREKPSFEKDTEGKNVLRVVDAAPHGYDEFEDRYKVDSTKANQWLESLYDAQIKTNNLLEVMTNTNAIYDALGERYPLSDGVIEGDGMVSREVGYLELTAQDDLASVYTTIETADPIDLTHVRFITLDWENSGVATTNNQSIIQVALQKKSTRGVAIKTVTESGAFERKETRLDVSDLKGKHFVKVIARDGHSSGSAESKLKVYEIKKEC